eukprot:TRINITY_DN310_c0_g1_i10.p2 TRINITY_DN310_c0_g1~~TRINITY_DN310_c0_g1_i10.p2  ORF type:complete len:178 (-),score=48.99 TRINITY_DN310_c0_g1_i10:216-749(-)
MSTTNGTDVADNGISNNQSTNSSSSSSNGSERRTALERQQQIHIDAIKDLKAEIKEKETELKDLRNKLDEKLGIETSSNNIQKQIERWEQQEQTLESEIQQLKMKLEKEEAERNRLGDDIRNLILQGTFHLHIHIHIVPIQPLPHPSIFHSFHYLHPSPLQSTLSHPQPPHHTFLRN